MPRLCAGFGAGCHGAYRCVLLPLFFYIVIVVLVYGRGSACSLAVVSACLPIIYGFCY